MSEFYYNRQLTSYLTKQKKFISFINNIQNKIKTKNYKKEGYTFDSFVKTNWNISKAQIYRYLIAAKILDQLQEFKILPNYERLCRCIAKLTKTPEQIKLLWKTILDKVENRLNEINSSYITKTWNELCQDERYSHICHNEKNIIKNIENSLNKYTKAKKYKEIHTIKTEINSSVSDIQSPILNENNMQINNDNTKILYNTSLLVLNNNDINNTNTTINNSKQLNITSPILYNPIINNINNYNSQINTIPPSFSYDSLNSNYGSNSTLNESNNNSNALYVPVTNVNTSNNNNYYTVSNKQSNIQDLPVTSTNIIYYVVDNTYQQPMMMSPVSPIQTNINY